MLISEILEKAADLIEPEGRWTQAFYARAKDGSPVRASSDYAVCWCLLGSIKRVGGFNSDSELHDALNAIDRTFRRRPKHIHEWNDAPGRTQAEVVAKLREAAAKARDQGK